MSKQKQFYAFALTSILLASSQVEASSSHDWDSDSEPETSENKDLQTIRNLERQLDGATVETLQEIANAAEQIRKNNTASNIKISNRAAKLRDNAKEAIERKIKQQSIPEQEKSTSQKRLF